MSCDRCEDSSVAFECLECATSEDPDPVIYCARCNKTVHIGRMSKHNVAFLKKKTKVVEKDKAALYKRKSSKLQKRIQEAEAARNDAKNMLGLQSQELKGTIVSLHKKLQEQTEAMTKKLKLIYDQKDDQLIKIVQHLKKQESMANKQEDDDSEPPSLPILKTDFSIDCANVAQAIDAIEIRFMPEDQCVSETGDKDLVAINTTAGAEIEGFIMCRLSKAGTFWLMQKSSDRQIIVLERIGALIRYEYIRDLEWQTYGESGKEPGKGDLVFALFEHKWYRGRIEELKSSKRIGLVRFLDYGGAQTIPYSQILPVKTGFTENYPYQALECCLYGCFQEEVAMEARWEFNDVVPDRPAKCILHKEVEQRARLPCWYVDLFVTKNNGSVINVSEAVYKKAAELKLPKSSISCRDIRYMDSDSSSQSDSSALTRSGRKMTDVVSDRKKKKDQNDKNEIKKMGLDWWDNATEADAQSEIANETEAKSNSQDARAKASSKGNKAKPIVKENEPEETVKVVGSEIKPDVTTTGKSTETSTKETEVSVETVPKDRYSPGNDYSQSSNDKTEESPSQTDNSNLIPAGEGTLHVSAVKPGDKDDTIIIDARDTSPSHIAVSMVTPASITTTVTIDTFDASSSLINKGVDSVEVSDTPLQTVHRDDVQTIGSDSSNPMEGSVTILKRRVSPDAAVDGSRNDTHANPTQQSQSSTQPPAMQCSVTVPHLMSGSGQMQVSQPIASNAQTANLGTAGNVPMMPPIGSCFQTQQMNEQDQMLLFGSHATAVDLAGFSFLQESIIATNGQNRPESFGPLVIPNQRLAYQPGYPGNTGLMPGSKADMSHPPPSICPIIRPTMPPPLYRPPVSPGASSSCVTAGISSQGLSEAPWSPVSSLSSPNGRFTAPGHVASGFMGPSPAYRGVGDVRNPLIRMGMNYPMQSIPGTANLDNCGIAYPPPGRPITNMATHSAASAMEMQARFIQPVPRFSTAASNPVGPNPELPSYANTSPDCSGRSNAGRPPSVETSPHMGPSHTPVSVKETQDGQASGPLSPEDWSRDTIGTQVGGVESQGYRSGNMDDNEACVSHGYTRTSSSGYSNRSPVQQTGDSARTNQSLGRTPSGIVSDSLSHRTVTTTQADYSVSSSQTSSWNKADFSVSSAQTSSWNKVDSSVSSSQTSPWNKADSSVSSAQTSSWNKADSSVSSAQTSPWNKADSSVSSSQTSAWNKADASVSSSQTSSWNKADASVSSSQTSSWNKADSSVSSSQTSPWNKGSFASVVSSTSINRTPPVKHDPLSPTQSPPWGGTAVQHSSDSSWMDPNSTHAQSKRMIPVSPTQPVVHAGPQSPVEKQEKENSSRKEESERHTTTCADTHIEESGKATFKGEVKTKATSNANVKAKEEAKVKAMDESKVKTKPGPGGDGKSEVTESVLPQESSFNGVVLSRLEENGRFWLQRYRDENAEKNYQSFVHHLRDLAKIVPSASNISPGMMLLIPGPRDGWHRGLVEYTRDSKAAVRLVDYGQVVTVGFTTCKTLPERFQTIPFQAFLCSLATKECSNFNRPAQEKFAKLVKRKTLKVEVKCVSRGKLDLYEVNLFDYNTPGGQPLSIYDEICNEGLVQQQEQSEITDAQSDNTGRGSTSPTFSDSQEELDWAQAMELANPLDGHSAATNPDSLPGSDTRLAAAAGERGMASYNDVTPGSSDNPPKQNSQYDDDQWIESKPDHANVNKPTDHSHGRRHGHFPDSTGNYSDSGGHNRRNKPSVRCFNCRQFGHIKLDCPHPLQGRETNKKRRPRDGRHRNGNRSQHAEGASWQQRSTETW